MQRDTSTYCDEPEDGNDFAAFVATFNMDERYLPFLFHASLSSTYCLLQLHILPCYKRKVKSSETAINLATRQGLLLVLIT